MSQVYLSGPIFGRDDSSCVLWRQTAAGLLTPLDVVDPVKARDTRRTELTTWEARALVEADLKDIRKSDGLLVMYDMPSVGTSMEIFFARSLGIPVYVVDLSDTGRPPWLAYHASAFFYDLREACSCLKMALLKLK